MYLGVQGLMPRDLREVTPNTVDGIRAHGFTGVACRFFQPLSVTRADVEHLRGMLESGGVVPCQAVAQHPDLVAADPAARRQGVTAMQRICEVTRWLGTGNL